MIQEIKILLDGVESKPFFNTEEDYQRFRNEFMNAMFPELEKHKIARMNSERDAMYRIVD